MKRILDCTASDFAKMTGQDIKKSIIASEGRTLLSEVIGAFTPIYPAVTNAEMAAAFGADLILVNFFDVFNPEMQGMPNDHPEEIIRDLKKLVGRPIGLNLEPVDMSAEKLEKLTELPEGRIATERSIRRAKELGFDFVCLTGNPKTGVSNTEITKAISVGREVFGPEGLIIAGKMHGAGVAGETGSTIMSEETLHGFIEAGADIILIPSPGTVPGFTVEKTSKLVDIVHKKGALAILTTGTSQEGSDEATVRQIALNSKMAGADLYHIGDAGAHGIALPENIMAYSIVVRGKRHTYIRMAASVVR
ncbi:haloacid dehalogenase-like hydrolase [Neobacillus notoginsengisoli]|uniref:Haloacid dehalogenase-like hydrolase n=1 Tax=Neobacillus notoginsengisoli TaxID=1578198 RepID=A0A417YSH9_9BACI|nr:haloacid dehalogenase-like hydrolase [Neobacillus notoginsengisoli]RHW38937.1 haloacid dehalogenase-like hydrolase [Neobacillus notoginsengisoli]